MKKCAVCLIIFASVILMGCDPPMRYGAFKYQDISADSLFVISKAVEERFDKHGFIFTDNDIESYLHSVLDRLITPQEKEQHNLNVKILRTHTINAFGYPHGTIFITISLLTKLNNEAQLAAVLSHELIHIVNKHPDRTLERLKRSPSPTRLHPVLAALFADEGVNADAGVVLGAAMRGYSRELEREADSLGLFRMAEGGYPHEEFLSLLLLLKNHIESENIAEQSFFNSHPRITERIRNYHRIVNENNFNEVAVCKDCDVFKEQIKKTSYENVRVNISAGRYDSAETQIEKFLAVDSCDTEALILHGDFERSLSPRSTEFLIWYKRALECDFSNIAALRAVGYGYYAIGNFQNAHEYLLKYSEAAQNASDIGTVRIMLGKCEEHIEKDEKR